MSGEKKGKLNCTKMTKADCHTVMFHSQNSDIHSKNGTYRK